MVEPVPVVVEPLDESNARDVQRAADAYQAAFENSVWRSEFQPGEALLLVKAWLRGRRYFPATRSEVFVAKQDGNVVGVAYGGYRVRGFNPDVIKSASVAGPSKLREKYVHAPAAVIEWLNAKRPYELTVLAVHPDHRGHGIQAALDAARLAHARSIGADVVVSYTINPDRRKHLLRSGFEPFVDRDEPRTRPPHYFKKRL